MTIAIVILTGCRTSSELTRSEESRIEWRNRVEWRDRLARDTVYVRDSVMVEARGDTVRIDRWRVKYVERVRVDTSYVHRSDTVYVSKTRVERTEARLGWWDRLKLGMFPWLLLVACLSVAYLLFRLWRLR